MNNIWFIIIYIIGPLVWQVLINRLDLPWTTVQALYELLPWQFLFICFCVPIQTFVFIYGVIVLHLADFRTFPRRGRNRQFVGSYISIRIPRAVQRTLGWFTIVDFFILYTITQKQTASHRYNLLRTCHPSQHITVRNHKI